MSEEVPPPKRVRLSREDFDNLSKEDLFHKWSQQETYVAALESKNTNKDPSEELQGLRESEEKLKQQQIEATRRENILVMRLTTKEQEMQECANQIQELKTAQNQNTAQLRSLLLDPAINLLFQRMKREMDATKEKLEQTQSDLAAWKFTPDSQTGKRLMAKCRMLLTENEELGKVISSGRMAKLEGEIALEKTLVQEMKKSQEETDEFLVELDEDQEGMQTTIYLLQQQLKDCKEQMQQLQAQNQQLQQLATKASSSAAEASKLPFSSSSTNSQQQSVTNSHATPPHEGASNQSYFSNHTQSILSPDSSQAETTADKEPELRTGGVVITQPSVSASDLYSPSSPSPVSMETSSSAGDLIRTAALAHNSNNHVSKYSIHSNHGKTANHGNDSSTRYQQQQQHHHSPLPSEPEPDSMEPNKAQHMLANETNGEDHISEEMAEEDSQTPELDAESGEDTTAEDESESSETIITTTTHKVNNHHHHSLSSPVSTSTGGGGFAMESTDASSDAWSPPPVTRHNNEEECGLNEDSSDHMVSEQSSLTTEGKSITPQQILMPNGLDDIPQSTSEDET